MYRRDALQGRTYEEGRPYDSQALRRNFGVDPDTSDHGFLEALNGLFQAAKRRARGYANLETMRTVLFLIAGKALLQVH